MLDVLVVAGGTSKLLEGAMLAAALKRAGLSHVLLHASEPGGERLPAGSFGALGLPEPDLALDAGTGSPSARTARMMALFEAELTRLSPSVAVIVGDLEPLFACAFVTVKHGIPVATVGAGTRACDRWTMGDTNRRLCDQLAVYLFAADRQAAARLMREGIEAERVVVAGSTLGGVLHRCRQLAPGTETAARLGCDGAYGVLALEHPEALERDGSTRRVFEAAAVVSRFVRIIFPTDSHGWDGLDREGAGAVLAQEPGFVRCEPLDYPRRVGLLSGSSLVITDSAAVEEEAVLLGVPWLTLREASAWAGADGAAHVGTPDTEAIVEAALTVLEGETSRASVDCDRDAADRIAEHLRAELLAGLPAAASSGSARPLTFV